MWTSLYRIRWSKWGSSTLRNIDGDLRNSSSFVRATARLAAGSSHGLAQINNININNININIGVRVCTIGCACTTHMRMTISPNAHYSPQRP